MGMVTRKLWRGEFGTSVWDCRLSALFRSAPSRPQGTELAPALVTLEAELPVSAKPPVRIFLGTEPAQSRAERVFVWSIMQVRDPHRRYEIHLMRDLVGFDRSLWKTGFTNYRYAIPKLAGEVGRAIYNDVDQIFLDDPARLFDLDMGDKGVLAISPRETSVMLIDCERMAPVWTLSDAQTVSSHHHFRQLVSDQDLWGTLPAAWNSRDHEYREGESKLLHYTILHRQPWQPFPDILRYQHNPLGHLWQNLERAADRAGFQRQL